MKAFLTSRFFLPTLLFTWGILQTTIPASLPAILMPPPPANDACQTPSEIALPGANWGVGTAHSDTVQMTFATRQAGEIFPEPGEFKSVWFQFSLPTYRYFGLELKQLGDSIPLSDCKLVVYFSSDCFPDLADANAAGLAYPTGFNLTSNSCFKPGNYLVQVYAKPTAAGSIYLEVTLDFPPAPPFDRPAQPHDFGILDGSEEVVLHPLQCHSLDSAGEVGACPPHTDATFGRSVWYEFATDDAVDIVSLMLEEKFGSPLPYQFPPVVLLRLFEGKTSQSPWASLPVVEECVEMKKVQGSYSRRWHEWLCKLNPNANYSLQLLFPTDFELPQMDVHLFQRGEPGATSPLPLASQMPASYKFGVLPQSISGLTSNLTGNFSCQNFIADHPCGAVQPAAGVTWLNGSSQVLTGDLVEWFTFELAADATITFNLSYLPQRFVRIFKKDLTDDCNALDPVADLYAEFSGYPKTLTCMPPGKYSIQVMGISNYAFAQSPNSYYSAFDNGSLGRKFTLSLTAKTSVASNGFGLAAPGEVYRVNQGLPLQDNVLYQTPNIPMPCSKTVLPPLPAECSAYDRASYILASVADAGLVTIGNLPTQPPLSGLPPSQNYPDLGFNISRGDANVLATAQGAHAFGQTIAGLEDIAPCITETDSEPNPVGLDACHVCAGANQILTLTALANEWQISLTTAPTFRFRKFTTQYASPQSAFNFGDVTAFGSYSMPDVFSCLDNPMVVGGLSGCGKKLIFSRFYL
ncbi:MAG: hypothetical protein AAB316_13675, partial [Bacteroidota bacterium]